MSNRHIYTGIPHSNHVQRYDRDAFEAFLLQQLDFSLDLVKQTHAPVGGADSRVLLKGGDRVSEAVFGLGVEGLCD